MSKPPIGSKQFWNEVADKRPMFTMLGLGHLFLGDEVTCKYQYGKSFFFLQRTTKEVMKEMCPTFTIKDRKPQKQSLAMIEKLISVRRS